VPIYEYRCPNGHLFEVFQRMDDAPPDVCEVCGAKPLEKVLHPVPIFFKGKGFYSTDYGRASRKREPRDGDAGTSTDGAKKTEKAEAKSETKKAEPAS
jgi:putative FmdB family regulatory protein